jgi:hypothetical protein
MGKHRGLPLQIRILFAFFAVNIPNPILSYLPFVISRGERRSRATAGRPYSEEFFCALCALCGQFPESEFSSYAFFAANLPVSFRPFPTASPSA